MDEHADPTAVSRYTCRGCGSVDSIVSVEVVPRLIAVRPGADGPDFAPEARDDAEWESSLTLGFACANEACRFWEGTYGVTADRAVAGADTFAIVMPPDIDVVAAIEVVDGGPGTGSSARA